VSALWRHRAFAGIAILKLIRQGGSQPLPASHFLIDPSRSASLHEAAFKLPQANYFVAAPSRYFAIC